MERSGHARDRDSCVKALQAASIHCTAVLQSSAAHVGRPRGWAEVRQQRDGSATSMTSTLRERNADLMHLIRADVIREPIMSSIVTQSE